MSELFDSYKINQTPRWPRLLRWGAGSLILHSLVVASVVYVPAVREMLNLASIFSGSEYVNEDYSKTAIGERAQIIKVGDKFEYPSGYFSREAPQQIIAEPQIIKVVEKRPQPTPRPTPKPTLIPTPVPTVAPLVAANAKPTPVAMPEGTSQTTPTPDAAEAALNKIAEENKVKRPPKINKKPFVDLLVKWKEVKDKGGLDLSGSIEMDLRADRNDDGTLSNVEIVKLEGDPKLKDVVKEFVQALSASRALSFLDGSHQLNMHLKLDQQNVGATIRSEFESEEMAARLSKGYGGLLTAGMGKAYFTNNKVELTIFKNTSIAPKGKEITVSFKLPRATAGDLLSKQIPPT